MGIGSRSDPRGHLGLMRGKEKRGEGAEREEERERRGEERKRREREGRERWAG